MSYIVTKTDGTVLTTIIDGTKDDSSSSITLLGRNYSNYGQFVANDFVQMLENFSYETAPLNPLKGQIWWKRDSNLLQVYTGTAWKVIGNATSTPSAPWTTTAGDIWWDSTNQQLYIYNGTNPYSATGWRLVGPAYSVTYGKSGAIWEVIQDSLGNNHHILSLYLDDVRTGIISSDNIFTPNVAIPGFITIQTGHNIRTNDTFWGTAQNANLLGNQLPSKYFRNDLDNVTSGNIVVLTNAGIKLGAQQQLTLNLNSVDASITNTALNGDIKLYVNVGGISTRILYIEGTSGVIEVAANPTTNLGIATKVYVDDKFTDTVLYGTPVTATPAAGDNDTSISTTAFVHNANVIMRNYVDSIDTLKANIANPVFTGNPRSVTPDAGDNDTSIATTAFVYSANVAMTGYVDDINSSLSADTLLRANIANPVFTGNPRSVTPAAGDNDTSIATTAFVYSANVVMRNYVDSIDTLKANIANPVFTGDPRSVTPTVGSNDTSIATTEFVYDANVAMTGYVDSIASAADSGLSLKANIASPTLTGVPKAPTMPADTANTAIATTSFVINNSGFLKNKIYQGNSYFEVVDSGTAAISLVVDGTLVLSATATGVNVKQGSTAYTQATGTNDTTIATTAFVQTATLKWGGSTKYVSTGAPSGGADGDIWFRYS